MKNWNKPHKLIWLTLLCFLIVIGKPSVAYAAETVDSKDGQWEIIADYNKNTCTVTKWKGSSTLLKIPSKIDGLKVTCIDLAHWSGRYDWNNINEREKITAISIPSTITSIEGGSFYNLPNLKKAVVPNTVKEIGDSLFGYCTSLTEVTLPQSITEIPNSTFSNCSSLINVKLSSKVKSFGHSVFYGCKALKTYKIPSTVTKIDFDCFAESGLKKITIPSTVKEINSKLFRGCESLTNVKLPSNLTEITSSMFADCKTLKSITIPASCKDVSYDAFSGCEALTTVLFRGNPTISSYYTAISPTAKLTIYAPSSSSNVKKYCSDKGIRFKTLNPPKLTSKKRTVSTVTLKWSAVSGATGYHIYKKTGTGAYQLVKTTKSLSFTDKNLKRGTTYCYYVRTLKKDALGKNLESNASATYKTYLKRI